MTPVNIPPADFPPGDNCETPQQRKQRQQKKRESCERFITVRVPAHKRRVCASEAAQLVRKKLVRAVGREAGKLTKAGLKKLGLPSGPKRPRRKRVIPKEIALPGGFGIETKPFLPKGFQQP